MNDKQIEKLANELYSLQDEYDMRNPFEIAKAVLSLGYTKIDYNNIDNIDLIILKGKRFVAIPENSMFISNEEYERFQKMENTLKRISTVSPTEAESENKALKETIGVVLAQKRNIWKSYNKKCEELKIAEEKATNAHQKAIKEFEERLKEKCIFNRKEYGCEEAVSAQDIEEIAKELGVEL